jgi:3-methylcrotonyl-CoA carboxylase beta subunit
MARLETRVDPATEEFQVNRAHNLALVRTLRERVALVQRGGDEEAVRRHRSRGKLLARERIERLLDPGTPFLELSPLAAWGMY